MERGSVIGTLMAALALLALVVLFLKGFAGSQRDEAVEKREMLDGVKERSRLIEEDQQRRAEEMERALGAE